MKKSLYLDMGHAIKILPNYSYEDYVQWKGRWELVEGIPFAMAPSASPVHQRMANDLGFLLKSEIKNSSCNCNVFQPVDIKIAPGTLVAPDIIISCRIPEGAFFDFPPELVVEIILPTSRLRDTTQKLSLYQDFGVRYYIIVDPENETIISYELTEKVYQEMKDPRYLLDKKCVITPDFSNLFE